MAVAKWSYRVCGCKTVKLIVSSTIAKNSFMALVPSIGRNCFFRKSFSAAAMSSQFPVRSIHWRPPSCSTLAPTPPKPARCCWGRGPACVMTSEISDETKIGRVRLNRYQRDKQTTAARILLGWSGVCVCLRRRVCFLRTAFETWSAFVRVTMWGCLL